MIYFLSYTIFASLKGTYIVHCTVHLTISCVKNQNAFLLIIVILLYVLFLFRLSQKHMIWGIVPIQNQIFRPCPAVQTINLPFRRPLLVMDWVIFEARFHCWRFGGAQWLEGCPSGAMPFMDEATVVYDGSHNPPCIQQRTASAVMSTLTLIMGFRQPR